MFPLTGCTYARPDADALCRSLNEVALLAATAGEAELINAYDEAYEAYTWFYTMGNLAYLRYTLDLNDSYYETEYQWCEEQSPLVEQALEECYIAMGRSDLRDTLERDYFGEDFFTSYDNGGFYSDEQVVALFQQEAELESRYMAMQSDMTVNFQGREQLVDELLSDPSITYNDYYDILELYYEKYNPQAAEIYIQLVQVRRELAQRLGYESYAAFAYAFNYYRDYTPAQAETYIEAVRQQLVPVYEDAAIPSQLPSAEMDDVMSALRQSVRTIGMEPGNRLWLHGGVSAL